MGEKLKMKITKAQLKEIIKEEIEEILPRSEAAAKMYRGLAAQIAEMILDLDKELFGPSGGMDRGALLYVLEQTEKMYYKRVQSEESPGLQKEAAQLINKIVSKDGKRKGVKISGTWKDRSIKAKWMDKDGNPGPTVDVADTDYTRKDW